MFSKTSVKNSERKGNRNCCVVNCRGKSDTNLNIHFYSFPSRPWEQKRKQQWITAVRRVTPEGKPWNPTKNSRICSLHFRGGEKSNNPSNEAFNPTIFPSAYKKGAKSMTSERTIRLRRRQEKMEDVNKCVSVDNYCGDSLTSMNVTSKKDEQHFQCREISTQTNPIFDEETVSRDDEISTLYCWQSNLNNEASTQTSIIIRTKLKQKLIAPTPKQRVTIRVGPDCPSTIGFLGYEDMKNDQLMKQLTGISLNFFHVLLEFIQPGAYGQSTYYRTLDAPNRLLLFLMKMKLGLSFAATGCILKVSKTTASTIFYEILTTLFEKIKTWVFWPSREAIKETMPTVFKKYPNCRAIIDCTELRCDTPPTLEQRCLMYSSYKSDFTVKYLIAITPSGMISFISKGYGGRSTDGFIVNDSGFINLVEPGDQIMADKGFPQIKTSLLERQCISIIPPVALNPQFTAKEVQEGYSIASVRVHVERAIQRVRVFQILRHINIELLNYIDKIMYVACVLANNKEPLIRTEDQSRE